MNENSQEPTAKTERKVIMLLAIVVGVSITVLLLLEVVLIEKAITFKPNIIPEVVGIVTTLSVISLAIQSAIQVFASNVQTPKKENMEVQMQDEEMIRQEKNKISRQTRRIAYVVSLSSGLLISISGVRIIQPLTRELDLSDLQLRLFHLLDILLTAVLISGGTEGIHRLTKGYEEFTKIKER